MSDAVREFVNAKEKTAITNEVVAIKGNILNHNKSNSEDSSSIHSVSKPMKERSSTKLSTNWKMKKYS